MPLSTPVEHWLFRSLAPALTPQQIHFTIGNSTPAFLSLAASDHYFLVTFL